MGALHREGWRREVERVLGHADKVAVLLRQRAQAARWGDFRGDIRQAAATGDIGHDYAITARGAER
jgi:hypothetical protein